MRVRFLPRLSGSGAVSAADELLEGPATAFAGAAAVLGPTLVPEAGALPALPGVSKYCAPLLGYACSYAAVS